MFLLRRILTAIPVMTVVAFLVFGLLYLAPGDPAALLAGEQASAQEVAEIRRSLGIDQPFLPRFLNWAWALLHGDFGRSIYSGEPVLSLILDRFTPTFYLMLLTMTLTVVLSLPMGVLAASRQGSALDRGVMMFAVLSFSMPVFVIGYLLAWVFAVKLGWFPVQGYSPPEQGFWPFISRLTLPALSLSSVFIALACRTTRASMIEVLNQDYVRTARAKGMPERVVLLRHALRCAAVPVVTIFGIGVGGMISGAVATETVFAIPGLGRLTVDAVLQRDYPVIQGLVLSFSLFYVVINLAVDLLYTVLDPRIRY